MSIKRCSDLGHVALLPPKKSRNSSFPHPYRPPLHHRGILQAPPLPGQAKLLWSKARKRSETLPLLTEAKLVELMYLHLPPVVGRLLANQVL